jgi:hypothetical protein
MSALAGAGAAAAVPAVDRVALSRAALAQHEADFSFLLSDKQVPEDMQVKLAVTGFTSVQMMALIADDRAGLREVLKDEPFNLDPGLADAAPGHRVRTTSTVATLIATWEAACSRTTERNRADAEKRAGGLPLALPGGDHVAIRRGYEQLGGRVLDKEYPAEALIERRLQQIEQGDLRADSLTETASKDECLEDPTDAVWFQGAMKIKKPMVKVPLPASTEELRKRVKLLGITFDIAKMKNPSRAWLLTATPGIWSAHIDHVLGDTVYGLKMKGPNTIELKVDWQTVLSYEFELRREATRLIQYDGLDLAAAMLTARRDTELRERCFTGPAMVSLITQASSGSTGPPRPPPFSTGSGGGDSGNRPQARTSTSKRQKRGGRNSGHDGSKGGGKGGGKDSITKGWQKDTPEGKPICFRYNLPKDKPCDGRCGRAHCCQICMGNHATVNHPAL